MELFGYTGEGWGVRRAAEGRVGAIDAGQEREKQVVMRDEVEIRGRYGGKELEDRPSSLSLSFSDFNSLSILSLTSSSKTSQLVSFIFSTERPIDSMTARVCWRYSFRFSLLRRCEDSSV